MAPFNGLRGVTANVQKAPGNYNLLIVRALLATAETKDNRIAEAMSADACLVKPFTALALRRKIEHIFGLRRPDDGGTPWRSRP